MKTFEEIKKEGVDLSLKDLEKIRFILNQFEKELHSKKRGISENAGIFIKTIILFLENDYGLKEWHEIILQNIIKKIENKRKQKIH